MSKVKKWKRKYKDKVEMLEYFRKNYRCFVIKYTPLKLSNKQLVQGCITASKELIEGCITPSSELIAEEILYKDKIYRLVNDERDALVNNVNRKFIMESL